MAYDDTAKSNKEWYSHLAFTKLFVFRTAIQPGKLMLALGGIILICLAGWILDGMTPSGSKVVVSSQMTTANGRAMTDLDAYVSGAYKESVSFDAYREKMRRDNANQLRQILMSSPLNKQKDDADDLIEDGDAVSTIQEAYKDRLDKSMESLEKRYSIRKLNIEKYYKELSDRSDKADERDQKLKDLNEAYQVVFEAMMDGRVSGTDAMAKVNVVVQEDSRQLNDEDRREDSQKVSDIRRQVTETILLAKAYQSAKLTQGQGIFSTIFTFTRERFDRAVHALIFGQNLAGVKQQFKDLLMVDCWLTRFHWFYAALIVLIKLAVVSVVGGAICRIAALQYCREEQIGPMQALRFSMSRFWSFFTAPLIPIGIILFIVVLMWVVSLVGALPVLGEILAGGLLILGLIGGAVVALLVIGLIGGFNLMFPTIAVEGSDSFDAISRSFSYVLSRPWRMGFYTAVSAVYGAICYLFVRFFVFMMLLVVRVSIVSINLDSSSLIESRDKLDAIWPAPSFSHLLPSVNWDTLNWSESLGAVLILMWVALALGLVLAFVHSFYFSANTMIYLLLRQKVDATDMEDVYVEEDVDELMAEEVSGPEGAGVANPAAEASSETGPADSGETAAPGDSESESIGGEEEPEKPEW